MHIPEDLLYTQDHEWVRVEKNVATIGITFYAQSELGDVVYVEMEKAEGLLRAGNVFGTIEAIKTVSDLFVPVSGKIISINEELEPYPELVNSEPYNAGWMIKINMSKPEELKTLMDAATYKKSLNLS